MIAFSKHQHPPPQKKEKTLIKIEQNFTKPKLYLFCLVVYILYTCTNICSLIIKTFYLSGVAAKSAVQMDKSSSQTAEKKHKKSKSGEKGFNLYTHI